MRITLKLLFCIIALELTMQRCANPATPTGGPRDTIPPVLLESNPTNGQVGFKENEFTLTFSEIVSADQLSQKLITTPKSDLKFKTFVKKNRLTIKFEEAFQDSTTYNLNFADGVVDITEKNPVENLSLAFSTGTYIDSMSVAGVLKDLFTQNEAKKYTVGLFPVTDSLDLLTDSPIYFTTTNDSGKFKLNYIKAGEYKLLAFNDDNKNIVFDPETESHGFLSGSIQLDSAVALSKPINTLLQNVTPIKYINNRSIGPYIELKYNKEIKRHSIQPDFQYNVFGEKRDGIRIYKSEQTPFNDSIQFIVTVSDSLSNTTIDTIKNVFQDNYRKPTKFNLTIDEKQRLLGDQNTIWISFNKPSSVSDSIAVKLLKDSTFSYSPDYIVTWNENLTKAKLEFTLLKDSVISQILASIPPDTIQTERSLAFDQTIKNFNLMLQIDAGSFYSVEKDTSALQSINYRTEESQEFGTIKFTIATDEDSFTTQLIDNRNEVKYSAKNDRQPTFSKVTPGKYRIRVLIDNNGDGEWSPGNLLNDVTPESIYIHPEETTVRENWIQEINISF